MCITRCRRNACCRALRKSRFEIQRYFQPLLPGVFFVRRAFVLYLFGAIEAGACAVIVVPNPNPFSNRWME